METDGVEFVVEVRIPCLICGVDIEIDNSIKQEIDKDNVKSAEECQMARDSGIDDHELFQWFLKWFRVEIVKKGKQRLGNRGWDGEGGDILRFCGNCKMELMAILENQKHLDELEKKVKNGLGEVKGKMERFEDNFESNGIYEKDPRFKLVRSKIANCDQQRSSLRQPGYLSSRRRLSKLKVNPNVRSKVVTPARTNDDGVAMVKVPFAMISSLYKTISDLHLISNNQPNTPDRLGGSSETRETLGNKIVQKPSIQKSVQIHKRRFCQNIIKKAKKNIQKKETCPRTTKNLTGMPMHKNSEKKSILVTASVLENCNDENTKSVDNNLRDEEQGNISQPVVVQDSSTSRSLRKRKTVQYADIILDDHQPDNSLSCKDNAKRDLNTKSSVNLDRNHRQGPSGNRAKVHIQKTATKTGKIIQENVCSRKSARLSRQKDIIEGPVKTQRNRMARKWNYRQDPSTNTSTFEGIKFSIRSDLPGKVSCNSCSGVILNNDRRTIRRHVIQHHTNLFACPQCPYRAEYENKLKIHIQTVHEGLLKTCPECGNRYANLRNHIRDTHEATARFKCGEQSCGKMFTRRCLLKTHENVVHRKLKPWKCTECTMSFNCKRTLEQHVNLHMGLRPYKCKENGCGNAYTSKWGLARHQRKWHENGSKANTKAFQRGTCQRRSRNPS